MGGCDFSTRPYSYDDTPGDSELLDFALTEDDLIYKVFTTNINVNHLPMLFIQTMRYISDSFNQSSRRNSRRGCIKAFCKSVVCSGLDENQHQLFRNRDA